MNNKEGLIKPLLGSLRVPGDKSVSHRAILFAAMANGTSILTGVLDSLDVRSTLAAVASLGAEVTIVQDMKSSNSDASCGLDIRIVGWGEKGPVCKANTVINCGNSGTTVRLLMGVLAGYDISVILVGDDSLSSRPMSRVALPLSRMGATIAPPDKRCISCDKSLDTLPLLIKGKEQLKSITHNSPVASAQVKSAIILAGLHASGTTVVSEPYLSRNHTELMLPAFGVKLQVAPKADKVATKADNTDLDRSFLAVDGDTSELEHATKDGDTSKLEHVTKDGDTSKLLQAAAGGGVSKLAQVAVKGGQSLQAANINVPGDPSSAAFLLVAAALIPKSDITVRGVLLNKTRIGFVEVMRRMGCDVQIKVDDSWQLGAEKVGDIRVCYRSGLVATKIPAYEIPTLIDEIPILALLATAASGVTVFRDVGELRVKESDRLQAIIDMLSSLGYLATSSNAKDANDADATDLIDLCVTGNPEQELALGGTPLCVKTNADHRLAMTWLVAKRAFGLPIQLDDEACVAVSYPHFLKDLEELR
ncbi:MAG: 3-phosphoshikimate 1-carboxyvinyltransferase [Coriobacteriales bacterium]|jgi:3-phosphoshikimate 1-carboxyvinyltransferase|nr:3-phosphoshikimate 1-carboxyvinyltransferase [Coriobacteriales bacterium]